MSNKTPIVVVAAFAALTTSANSQNIRIVNSSFIEAAVFFITGWEVGAIPGFYMGDRWINQLPQPVARKLSDRIIRVEAAGFVRAPANYEQSAHDPCVVLHTNCLIRRD